MEHPANVIAPGAMRRFPRLNKKGLTALPEVREAGTTQDSKFALRFPNQVTHDRRQCAQRNVKKDILPTGIG
jgi:hypothetical protein